MRRQKQVLRFAQDDNAYDLSNLTSNLLLSR